MGLLDFNNPQVMQGLMLMQGRKGQLPGLLQTIMQMQDAQKQRALQEQSAKQQQEMRDMQIAQMRQQQEQQQQIRSLGAKAFAPNQNLVAGDDEGNPMPSSGGGGMPEFARGLMGVDPMLGAQFMPKPKGPVALAEGGRLVDPDSGREIASNPKRNGPQVGATREIKSGGKILTYEWDGQAWKKIADAPQFKPDGPDKAGKPQLFDGPNGPMWISPPGAGGGAVPVMGPDGKPLQSKQSAKESADAEKAKRRTEGGLQRADFVLGKVREAIDQTGAMTAGPMGAVARNIPGTGGYNLNKTVDAIKANIGFAELQAMREASPTGGALGQVAVQELNMLQSVLGSLDTAQSPDQLLKSLYSIEKHYTAWKQAVQQSQAPEGGVRRYNPETGKIE